MKDLLDELKKLDDEEFKVSPDFSKNVMKEIKKQDRNKKIMYVTSIASVACVLGISVFLVNRSGMLSSTVNQASEKQSLLSTDRVTEEYSEESYNGAISFDSVNDIQAEAAGEERTQVAPTANNTKSEAKTINASKREYIEQIIDALKLHDFDIQDYNLEIIVYSKNVAGVLDVVEKFEGTEVGMSGDNIIVRLKD